MNTNLTGLAVASMLLAATPVSALEIFTATLDGAQEVPPHVVTGTGSSMVVVDGTNLDLSVSWSALTDAPILAHIHCCSPPGENSPPQIDFSDPIPKTASGTFAASFDLTTDLIGLSVDEFMAGLTGGLAYVNLHTPDFPGGEIRGQLLAEAVPIPEPSTAALLLAGLGVLGWIAALRRRTPAAAPVAATSRDLRG